MPQNLSADVPFLRSPQQDRSGEPARLPNLAFPKPEAAGLALRDPQFPIFEMVLGRSNFLPACFLEIGASRGRAVCKVKTWGVDFRGTQGEWAGTGFLVSPNILLTNNHVLHDVASAANATCIFNFQVDESNQLLATKGFRVNPERLFVTSKALGGLDYTFVWVDGDPGAEFGHINLDRRALQIATDEFANLIQHPGGEPKAVVLQENQVKWQDVVVVHYTSDSEHGSSGSCVFNNEWKPVALHHASGKAKDPAHGKYLYEGIKLGAIAASLETMAQDSPTREPAETLLRLFKGTDELMGFFGALGRTRPTPEPGFEVVVDGYKGEASDVDVGFWNIEWFNQRFDEKRDAVAKIIASMNLDIWAFEEVSPESTRKLVEFLNQTYQVEYDCAFSEPNASGGKQTTTVIWNTRTVAGIREQWPDKVEEWLRVDSRDFDDLVFEAVEGKVFDRYPGLFKFDAVRAQGQDPFGFYLVPLHLKAMGEGSKRRRMASKILAEAVKVMIGSGHDEDWVLGGDYNAELASDDFKDLLSAQMVALSAQDEAGGAMSYVKSPKSLIDHIFLSANLAKTYGADDYFIVAAEKTIPGYIASISDHRPVLVRLSLNDLPPGGSPEGALRSPGYHGRSPAVEELRQRLDGNRR
jgi:endonuclease/exonuclease/phosphatase family metal-dependent hydrolase/V8-like Glu-specific endopeptidase